MIGRNVRYDGIKVLTIEDANKIVSLEKSGKYKKRVISYILDFTNIAEVIERQCESLILHYYDTKNSIYLIEIRPKFKEKEPLCVILENKGDKPVICRTSYKLMLHRYKM